MYAGFDPRQLEEHGVVRYKLPKSEIFWKILKLRKIFLIIINKRKILMKYWKKKFFW